MYNSRCACTMLWITPYKGGAWKPRELGRAASAIGDGRSGVLWSDRREVRVFGADQVLIVTVDGVDERGLIVQRNGGHDVVMDVQTAGQQRFMVAHEHHPGQ